MLDDTFERDGHGEPSRERGDRAADPRGPLPDREVPLAPIATSDVIHRWLDGELAEPTGLRGDASRSVEFWRRIGEETERRSRMVTPPHVAARIMASLPDQATARATTPWWRKELQLSPAAALAVAISVFVLGMIAMSMLSN
jgi:hypothetical protein